MWILTILEDVVHVTVIALYRYVVLVHSRHLGVVLKRRYSVVVILVVMYFVPLLIFLIILILHEVDSNRIGPKL